MFRAVGWSAVVGFACYGFYVWYMETYHGYELVQKESDATPTHAG